MPEPQERTMSWRVSSAIILGGATPQENPPGRQAAAPDPPAPTCQSPGNPDTTSRCPAPRLEALQSRVTVGPEPPWLKCNGSSDWLALEPRQLTSRPPLPSLRFVIASRGEGGARLPSERAINSRMCTRGRR
ncbi:hypothetical protein NHX12_000899 [Muraenolepis orangiensis]|uniref:Uncharacterized protein n=1 Tax=Muraenolepis orangiensis TaxID=630683 RepID=A0A9Q0IHN5_9TELE|nr:hypothetical protein NHX12_000899 [Muraenolepis orangiensis]